MSKYSLAELRKLQEDDELDLSACGIQEFPNAVVQLPRLTKLDISSNSLVFLPESFCKMVKLVRLDFGNNQLHHLPDGIGFLVNLQSLNLYNNKLEDLPLSFANLKALKWLDLKKNPLNAKLAAVAGKCSTDAECKTAAQQVVNVYMGEQKKKIDAAKANEAKLRAKVQKAQEEEKIRKYQEKKKQMEEKKNTEEKEQKQREAGKSAAQHQLQQKLAAQKTVNAAAKDPSPSKKRLETKEKSRGFFSKLLRFVFTCIFYVSIITVTSSTIAIGLTCAGYENTAGVAPLCKDLSLLSSGKKASANLPNNFKNAFGAVLNGYQKQLQPYTAPVKKQVNDHYKKFAKTEIGGKIDKAIYNVHAKLVELFVKAQRFVRKQVDNVLVWWNKSGEKTFGPYLKGFVIGLKMVGEFVYDVILNIIAVIVHLSARVKAFFVAWTQGGFNAAMNTLNH